MELIRSIGRMKARAGPILSRLPAGKPVMVEVGVSAGLMSEYLLQQRKDLTWHGVDSWLPMDQQPAAYIESGDIHAVLAVEHVEKLRRTAVGRVAKFGDRAIIHHCRSVEAARHFDAVDLVFLDGDHSADGVNADIEAWWPVVRSGGWLGGHDYGNPDPRFRFGVKAAVGDFVSRETLSLEIADGLTWWVRKP